MSQRLLWTKRKVWSLARIKHNKLVFLPPKKALSPGWLCVTSRLVSAFSCVRLWAVRCISSWAHARDWCESFACQFSSASQEPLHIDPASSASDFDRMRLVPEPKPTGLVSDSLLAFSIYRAAAALLLSRRGHRGSMLGLGSIWLLLHDIMTVPAALAHVFGNDIMKEWWDLFWYWPVESMTVSGVALISRKFLESVSHWNWIQSSVRWNIGPFKS